MTTSPLTTLITIFVAGSCVAIPAYADPLARSGIDTFVESYCLDCHGDTDPAGGLNLQPFDSSSIAKAAVDWDTTQWETMLRRLRSRQMPPVDADRPTEQEYEVATGELESLLDTYAESHPRPGTTDAIRRLTRNEYRNAIRDLLALDIDVSEILPTDESSHGFDNITVGTLSPTLLSRYITAAQLISRRAVGRTERSPEGVTIRVPADQTQEGHVEGLPLGTRGGVLFTHLFIQEGEYEVQLRLARDRDEEVEGLNGEYQIDVLIDRQRVHRFTVTPPKNRDHTNVDANLKAKIRVAAGTHAVGVTFPRTSGSLLEIKRQPFDAAYNRHRHPRPSPAIFEVSIVGPFAAAGIGDMASRERIFICQPTSSANELDCGHQIVESLIRRAYRRSPSAEDLETPLRFFREALEEEGFEAGVEAALAAILVNPHFLFRVEHPPESIASGEAYSISDFELASRLSFFLWSSIPDDRLLELAESRQLRDPGVLSGEVTRMLADSRSESLVTNFASQWLHLRNLESIQPDLRLFPDFDDNLRRSFRRETELLFDSIVREDRSVTDLLSADFTFLDERLAKHYGIPHIYGSRFRRVDLDSDSHRGGVLRHGSILMVTSYATRTSPTIRGNWVLANILGSPPPPPPPNVPALKEKTHDANLTVRERLSQHRANPACASCHDLIDPVGFALDNFDAVGRWRDFDGGQPIDVSGTLPDGTKIDGVEDLESAIMKRPELFVSTLAEKLLTFALGRGVEPADGPEIRRIVRQAREDNYRFSTLVSGIVASKPFQMRIAE
ncbi:MAG: DUF1592 domain-containing protein [Planctomycetaceae bacterium]|nr:DUF1592 domain-containing protein [Planctomycetaceae bacterium]